MKHLKKIAYYFIVVVLAVLLSGVLGVYIYKDDIIDLLKEEINKQLKTELEVDKIDINLIKGFPNLAVAFKGVRFHSAFENEMLLTGDEVFFVLNVFDLLNKDIEIQRLEVDNGKLIIHRNKKGQNNYDVFKEPDPSDTTSSAQSLTVQSVRLTNVELVHNDETSNLNMTYHFDRLSGSAQFEEQNIEFFVQSTFSLADAKMKNLQWLVGKNIMITTKVLYDGATLSVPPSELAINTAQFRFSGNVRLKDATDVSIEISGEKNDFSSLVSILPQSIQEKLKPYNGKGTINFATSLKGKVLSNSWPGLTVSLQLTDFKINHKQLKEQLNLVDVAGELVIRDLKRPETGHFSLKRADIMVKDKEILVEGAIDNFENPSVSGILDGDLDVPWLLSIGDIELEGPASGSVHSNLRFNAKLVQHDNDWAIANSSVTGSCELLNVSIDLPDYPSIQDVRGIVSWTNTGIRLDALDGSFGESSFVINGGIENFNTLFETNAEQTLMAGLYLKSHRIDLDEIVDFITGLPADTSAVKSEARSNPLVFDLGLSVDTLTFRRFRSTNVRAQTRIERKRITIEKLTANGMGGQVAVSGSIMKQLNNDFFIEANVKTNTIELDSLFYVFHNFQQDFITDQYLKGKLNANIYTSMYFDEHWRFRRNLLFSEALLQIKKGELNDFEPIMELSSYLNNSEEKLSRLRFSDLNSRIDIANDTVFISDMYVGTNVRNIKIGGYHTLDQHIDYRLSVPVINDNKDKDQKFGEVKKDKEGRLYWPFRIKGTTDDYKVNYDLGRAGSNIVKGFKREVTELGNTLIGKPKKEAEKDTLTLEDDEYFDWDDN